MERFTISLEESLAQQFDQLVVQAGYQNRSEAVRDLIRAAIGAARSREAAAGHCVANLSYVYNHHERALSERLTEISHEYHDIVVVTTHVHLDHDNCLETALLRGPTAKVRRFGESIMAERGVRHGQINIVPVDMEEHHDHGHENSHPHGPSAGHMHVIPEN